MEGSRNFPPSPRVNDLTLYFILFHIMYIMISFIILIKFNRGESRIFLNSPTEKLFYTENNKFKLIICFFDKFNSEGKEQFWLKWSYLGFSCWNWGFSKMQLVNVCGTIIKEIEYIYEGNLGNLSLWIFSVPFSLKGSSKCTNHVNVHKLYAVEYINTLCSLDYSIQYRIF